MNRCDYTSFSVAQQAKNFLHSEEFRFFLLNDTELQQQIENNQKPLTYVSGITFPKYLLFRVAGISHVSAEL